jgi:hypothetical protein
MKEIFTALIAAQNEISTISKNKTGYGYKYADLTSIIETTKPILKNHGLAIVQTVTHNNVDLSRIGIKTTLIHESGQSIEDIMFLPRTDMKGVNDVQALGASITYGRRYAYSALLNIATDEDTDGVTNRPKPASKPINKPSKEKGNIEQLLKAIKTTDGIESLNKIKAMITKKAWVNTEVEQYNKAIVQKEKEIKALTEPDNTDFPFGGDNE